MTAIADGAVQWYVAFDFASNGQVHVLLRISSLLHSSSSLRLPFAGLPSGNSMCTAFPIPEEFLELLPALFCPPTSGAGHSGQESH